MCIFPLPYSSLLCSTKRWIPIHRIGVKLTHTFLTTIPLLTELTGWGTGSFSTNIQLLTELNPVRDKILVEKDFQKSKSSVGTKYKKCMFTHWLSMICIGFMSSLSWRQCDTSGLPILVPLAPWGNSLEDFWIVRLAGNRWRPDERHQLLPWLFVNPRIREVSNRSTRFIL